MTVGGDPSARTIEQAGPAAPDVTAAAAELMAGLAATPWGQVSPSVYETGRLVALAPWLVGHTRRLGFLLAAQRPDGGWGGPGGYAVVPTLSATDALLAELRRSGDDHGRTDLARAADRGLAALSRLADELDGRTMPDMPAADLIAAALVESIDRALAGPVPGVAGGPAGGRPRTPRGLDGTKRLSAVRALLSVGAAPPEKLLHALEAVGGDARGVPAARPGPTGIVGASPAATAAWLGGEAPVPEDPARRFLEMVVEQHGGPVPCGLPITVFERAWVITTLVRAGIGVTVPPTVLSSLRQALDPVGTPAGEGLPADADTTAGALYALGLLGLPFGLDGLEPYRMEKHFCTWQGEDGFSVSTNAHVLEAFGQYLVRHPDSPPRIAEVVPGLAALVRDHQRADGSWHDRWHASPYYATACCVLALGRFGGDRARATVRRAVRWLLATQRADGSWGRWEGTAEETAYATQVLLLVGPGDGACRAAAARGYAYLVRTGDSGGDGPALWHDKDLYRPTAIVRAAVLAAVRLARRDPGVMALVREDTAIGG
ncbi:prenyltransferase/squalene oxidase repeat-containing protein [Actinoallomurus sp. NPDC052308]|uniref:prenyltransferase/squalene oxidase repeat-containing protein n=1 Tax=Actinoallomurus sp. NPDC052308 TaxID=3155530 RepID=UPI00343B08C0